MSTIFSFVPRQVGLHYQLQSASAQKNVKRTKTSMAKRPTSPAESAPSTYIEMKDKKKKKKKKKKSDKKSSRTKLLLLQSIASYLETNGFASTLSALCSEAELENTDYKVTAMDLEDIFVKELESREAGEEMTHGATESKSCVDLEEVKASDKPLIDSHMALTEKKKTQQFASDEIADVKKFILEPLADKGKNLDLDLSGAIVQNVDKYKKKKHKKASDHNDGVREGNDLGESRETVVEKVEVRKCLVHSPTNGIDDPTTKQKEKKKKKKKASDVLLVNNEVPKSNSDEISEKLNLAVDDNADTQPLHKKDAKRKDKKKKNKSTSEGISEVSAIDIRDSMKGESEKTVSKKRKRSQSEEKESQQNMEAKDYCNLKSEAADDNSFLSTLQNGHEPQQLTKMRKTKNKENGSMENGIHYENDSENQEANGLVNGKLTQSKVDDRALSVKKETGSAEPKTVHAFQRVKVDTVEYVDERLQDNSYWAKDGADNGYGAKAQEVLGQVRGRNFRHEKTKKKRGSYRGGQIDLHSHSIKFNYSDEE